MTRGRLIDIGDTNLHIVERGRPDGHPLLILHGGPGLDHHSFGDYLDPLGDEFRLLFVDQRSQGLSDQAPPETWTFARHVRDVDALASSMGLDSFAVLGHSFGAFVALGHAVEYPGGASHTVISNGIPSSSFLDHIETSVATLEPPDFRERVQRSWEAEKSVRTVAEMGQLLYDQLPFLFADPEGSVVAEFERRSAGSVFAPDLLRAAANGEVGAFDFEDRLDEIPQPVLVIAARHDRICSVPAAVTMAHGIPHAELVVLEHSGHLCFAEETDSYLAAVRGFLSRRGES